MNNNANIIQKQLDDFTKSQTSILRSIGQLRKSEADKAFSTKSFDGKNWDPDKDPDGELMVKSGNLKNSIKITQDFNSVTISSDVPYAKYHNEGTNKLPKRQFLGEFNLLTSKIKQMIINKTKQIFR